MSDGKFTIRGPLGPTGKTIVVGAVFWFIGTVFAASTGAFIAPFSDPKLGFLMFSGALSITGALHMALGLVGIGIHREGDQ